MRLLVGVCVALCLCVLVLGQRRTGGPTPANLGLGAHYGYTKYNYGPRYYSLRPRYYPLRPSYYHQHRYSHTPYYRLNGKYNHHIGKRDALADMHKMGTEGEKDKVKPHTHTHWGYGYPYYGYGYNYRYPYYSYGYPYYGHHYGHYPWYSYNHHIRNYAMKGKKTKREALPDNHKMGSGGEDKDKIKSYTHTHAHWGYGYPYYGYGYNYGYPYYGYGYPYYGHHYGHYPWYSYNHHIRNYALAGKKTKRDASLRDTTNPLNYDLDAEITKRDANPGGSYYKYPWHNYYYGYPYHSYYYNTLHSHVVHRPTGVAHHPLHGHSYVYTKGIGKRDVDRFTTDNLSPEQTYGERNVRIGKRDIEGFTNTYDQDSSLIYRNIKKRDIEQNYDQESDVKKMEALTQLQNADSDPSLRKIRKISKRYAKPGHSYGYPYYPYYYYPRYGYDTRVIHPNKGFSYQYYHSSYAPYHTYTHTH